MSSNSLQKFRSFVEESTEGITLLDEQGQIIEWNQARERMTGLKADQVTPVKTGFEVVREIRQQPALEKIKHRRPLC